MTLKGLLKNKIPEVSNYLSYQFLEIKKNDEERHKYF